MESIPEWARNCHTRQARCLWLGFSPTVRINRLSPIATSLPGAILGSQFVLLENVGRFAYSVSAFLFLTIEPFLGGPVGGFRDEG
jgi:hypothetical protein